jgi:hypothetical protein
MTPLPAACKARWHTMLCPALGPLGEPLSNRLRVEPPSVLQAWEPVAPGRSDVRLVLQLRKV